MLYLAQNIYSPRTIIVASSNMTSDKKWWLDPYFLIVLLAACIYWAGLYAMTLPNPNWFWPIQTPAAFLYPALVYPVLEEIVFRGLIQDWLSAEITRPGRRSYFQSQPDNQPIVYSAALHQSPTVVGSCCLYPCIDFRLFQGQKWWTGRSHRPAHIL